MVDNAWSVGTIEGAAAESMTGLVLVAVRLSGPCYSQFIYALFSTQQTRCQRGGQPGDPRRSAPHGGEYFAKLPELLGRKDDQP